MKNILNSVWALFILVIVAGGCNSDDDAPVIPGDVGLVFPLKDQPCEQGINSAGDRSRIFFEWTPAENAQRYDLVVNDLETGENFITYTEIYDTKKELELVHNRAYSWYVISRNIDSEETGMSPEWNFFFVGEPKDNYAPFPARLLSPGYGSTIRSSDGMVNLEWETSDPDGDQLSYTLYLDEVDGMQQPDDGFTAIENTAISLELDGGRTYYWRIKASDGANSSYSPVYTFSVE
ncbi:hypothetical protein [Sinomicrobium soli]|uniref:hypothetical protein n=1 Tax=Sinomicrobium sp. N-1-3-6 TaxID=2219864 RepID=UPI000DCC312A|nr:hypothetical protein [Sinomicrobium sp. N-1-3-6]RAV28023.1 hypothetical protein DN748_15880 [Sinomicrobium sp. N-1-3-6]